MDRPEDLFDREQAWSDLARFASDPMPGVRLGVVYGRRRQGKSFLLRRLARGVDGLYTMALEHERRPALDRFADDLASKRSMAVGTLRFDRWETALAEAVRGGGLVVIDELPYLLRHSPELPSILQALHDDHRTGPPTGIILCGSAFSVMSDLLSGAKALRGRAILDLLLGPFDPRTARRYWGIEDPEVAFIAHALVGGTPGYRDLIRTTPPQRVRDVGRWLATSLLDPSHALFREADYLLREDPRVTDRGMYHAVLAAIAGGARTPTVLGQRIGRDARALAHPLDVLTSAGFVTADADAFSERKPSYRVVDPVLRFDEVVIRPHTADLEERNAEAVWARAAPAVASAIYGPHFEELARIWTRTTASSVLGVPIGPVAPASINDASQRTQLQVDVVALERGARAPSRSARVLLIGEAKASERARTMADVERLRRARDLLVTAGIDASRARLALFGRAGFSPDLHRTAAADGTLLVDLAMMYTES